MNVKMNILGSHCPPALNPIPYRLRWRGVLASLLIAAATLAVPAARGAVSFPMYVSSGNNLISQVSSTGVVSSFARKLNFSFASTTMLRPSATTSGVPPDLEIFATASPTAAG